MAVKAGKGDGIRLPVEPMGAFGAIEMADESLAVAWGLPGLDGEAADFSEVGIAPAREFDVNFAGIVGVNKEAEYNITIQQVDAAVDQEAVFAVAGELGGINFGAVPDISLLSDLEMEAVLIIDPDALVAVGEVIGTWSPVAALNVPGDAGEGDGAGAWLERLAK